MNSNTNKDKKEDFKERVLKDVGKDQKSTAKSRKPRIFIAGDSMVRELKGWLMSRNKSVKVYSFSGATAGDTESFLVPLLNKNPDHIMLHVGTNNLVMDSPEVIVDKILSLTKMITSRGITYSISQIIVRDHKLWHKVSKVNDLLAKKVTEGISTINHDSITVEHLNRSRLHLNRRGVGALAFNMIKFIKTSSFDQPQV